MITNGQRRNLLVRRINSISADKLQELEAYIANLESKNSSQSRTLSYAGVWKDLDDDVFADLTNNLTSNRQKNRSRIDG